MRVKTTFEYQSERIATLARNIEKLEFDIRTRDVRIAALEKQNAELLEMLQELEDRIVVPAKDCSCHISPPCNDCVDYAGLRETLEAVDRVLQKAALQLSTQEVSK